MKFKVKDHQAVGGSKALGAGHALLRREILARGRVIEKHHHHIKIARDQRLSALYVRQAVSRIALIVTGLAIAAICARLINNTYYFITGVDYHILDGFLS